VCDQLFQLLKCIWNVSTVFFVEKYYAQINKLFFFKLQFRILI
jgi:hypothetical protein